jgi:phage-related tail protein
MQGSQGGGMQGRTSHAGRGPKGYRRSDERIEEDINEQLTRHPEIDATEIEVRVKGGEVTLMGTVDDRQSKRLAEDIVEQCSGVAEVHNQIRLNRGGGGSSSMTDREVTRSTEREGGRSEASSGSGSEPRAKSSRSSTSGSSST